MSQTDLPLLKQTILADFKADTKKAEDKLGALQVMIGKVTSAWNVGFQIAEKALDLAKFSTEMRGLEKALPVGALESMRRATRGTVSDFELMRLGARSMTGELGLTREQMTQVTSAAMVLSTRGFGSVTDVSEKLVKALRSNGRGLDDLGISFDMTGLSARNTAQIMAKVNTIAADTSGLDSQALAAKQAETAIKNFGESVKRTIGAVVTDVLVGIMQIEGGKQGGSGDFWANVSGSGGVRALTNQLRQRQADLAKYVSPGFDDEPPGTPNSPVGEQGRVRHETALRSGGQSWNDIWGTANRLGGIGQRGSGGGSGAVDAKSTMIADALDAGFALIRSTLMFSASGGRTARFLGGFSPEPETWDWLHPSSGASPFGVGGLGGGAKSPWWSGTPGKIDAPGAGDLDKAWSGVGASATDAARAGFDALISGHKNVVKAMRDAAAAKLKMTAVEAGVDAAVYLYKGIAAAFWNPAAAGAYFAASAQAAAVAVLAGGASAVLATGGGGGGRGAAGSPSAGAGGFGQFSSGSSGGGGPSTVIVQVHGDVVGEDASQRVAVKIQRAIDKARTAGATRNSSAVEVG